MSDAQGSSLVPVALDPFQTIVAVSWESEGPYAVVQFETATGANISLADKPRPGGGFWGEFIPLAGVKIPTKSFKNMADANLLSDGFVIGSVLVYVSVFGRGGPPVDSFQDMVRSSFIINFKNVDTLTARVFGVAPSFVVDDVLDDIFYSGTVVPNATTVRVTGYPIGTVFTPNPDGTVSASGPSSWSASESFTPTNETGASFKFNKDGSV